MAAKTATPQELELAQQKHYWAVIKAIREATELNVSRRIHSRATGIIPLPRFQAIFTYIANRMGKQTDEGINEDDHAYLTWRKDVLYANRLAAAQKLSSMDEIKNALAAAEQANDKKKIAALKKDLHAKKNIPAMEAEIEKPYTEVVVALRKVNEKVVSGHKDNLEAFAMVFAKCTGLSKEEEQLLKSYLYAHDWSKLMMPLYWTAGCNDPIIDACPAFTPEGADHVLQWFFDCVVAHNTIEGSSLYGHHLQASVQVLPDTDAGRVVLDLLNNGTPSRLRWIERVADTTEASVNSRIITEQPLCGQASWPSFYMNNFAPGQLQGMKEEDFVQCFALVFQDNTIKTFKDCEEMVYCTAEPAKLYVQATNFRLSLLASSPKRKIISTMEFEEKSAIYKECRAMFLKKMKTACV